MTNEIKIPITPRGGVFLMFPIPQNNGELMQNNPATASSGVSETNEVMIT